MPGSGWMMPNPHSSPSPTQPDHTATAAGAAIRTNGQRFTGRPDPCGQRLVGVGLAVITGLLPPRRRVGQGGEHGRHVDRDDDRRPVLLDTGGGAAGGGDLLDLL
ncbi:MAG: hypothetical protein ACLPN6_08775 [Streptosporangiaceae bacterium]